MHPRGRQLRASAVRGILRDMKPRLCPACGSERIARAEYGMPAPDQADDERVFWAGCIVGEEHRYGCHGCGATFDRADVAPLAARR
jgi:hypothetical protein